MNNLFVPTIEKFTSSLDTVAKSDDKKTLGSVLSLVDSSHSAVFIYNDALVFQGLVSPYKTIYHSNHPYTTLVSSILFHPPKIRKTAKLYEVAEHMIASKIYMLPVFSEDDNIEGVIYLKDILLEILGKPKLLDFVKDTVRLRTPITAPSHSLVHDVFNLFKENGVSRLILVDDNGALDGIVTRGDLMDSVMKPTAKTRVPSEGPMGHYSYSGEKKARKEEPVQKFSSTVVSSLDDNTPIGKVVSQLISSAYNSVVLVDKQKVPTGFLSVKDILQAIAQMKPKEEVAVHIRRPSVAVSDSELAQVSNHLQLFGLKLRKRIDIERIEVTTDEQKNTKGQTQEFITTVMVVLVKGDPIVVLVKNRDFLDGVQDATSQIEKQQRRHS